MAVTEVISDFGARLRELRLQAGLTQEQLAQTLHITRQAVSGWERGRNKPDIQMILRLAQTLDVTVNDLFASGGEKRATVNYRPVEL